MTVKSARLPRNFHRTFKPERQYICALLRFAAAGKEGDMQSIAAETDIPTGKSTGKLPAIIDYCRGMGLLSISAAPRSAIKHFELSPFGRVVFFEDPYMKMALTQWLAHFHLCGVLHGAEVWYRSFLLGYRSLGMSFSRSQLESYLAQELGCSPAGIIGPLVGMYEDDASFGNCAALSEDKDKIIRQAAPIHNDWAWGLGAWLMQLIQQHFPESPQITLLELEQKTGWQSIAGWNLNECQRVLALCEQKGLITVDRQMQPWLIFPQKDATTTWKMIYADMI